MPVPAPNVSCFAAFTVIVSLAQAGGVCVKTSGPVEPHPERAARPVAPSPERATKVFPASAEGEAAARPREAARAMMVEKRIVIKCWGP